MFQETSFAALLQKVRTLDATALPAREVLDMATVNGAACLGLDGHGQLVPGAPADIIALDLRSPGMLPMHNPESQLVYAANGSEVRLNMINGRICYHDGKYPNLDYEGLEKEMKSVLEWARKQD